MAYQKSISDLLATWRDLGKSSLARNESLVGQVEEVLLEGPTKRGVDMFMGRTRGHRKVILPASERLVGEARARADPKRHRQHPDG